MMKIEDFEIYDPMKPNDFDLIMKERKRMKAVLAKEVRRYFMMCR